MTMLSPLSSTKSQPNRMRIYQMIISCVFPVLIGARNYHSSVVSFITGNKSLNVDYDVESKQDRELPSKENGYILKWKQGKVPYEISKAIPPQLKEAILKSIEEWNNNFRDCLLWVPHKDEKDFVAFETSSFCSSEIGRIKSKQEIFLHPKNCNEKGAILHEMTHTIGITHEHNRSDRDDYIEVLFLNIPFEWRKQYAKEEFEFVSDLGPYDYCSLMHYEVKSPDRNKPAFKVLQKGVDESCIGQRRGFSDIDKLKVRNFYCSDSNDKTLNKDS